MKWLHCAFFTMLYLPAVYAYTGLDGVCNYGKQVVPTVICYSPTIMKDTVVNGDIKVTGSLKAGNITVRSMIINGNVDIKDSQVAGAVNVTGDLSANNVEFKKGVAVTGTSIELSHSKVNGLVTITSTLGTPYLQVECGTVVTGSVLFADKAGVVQITGDALVQGKVVNGSLEFVKRKCD